MVERNQALSVWLIGCAVVCGACAGTAQVSSEADDEGAPRAKRAEVVPETISVAPPAAPLGNFAVMSIPGQDAPLEMKSLSVKVRVEGRFARTEVTQVFHNHTEGQVEGTYTFTLPRGAAIARLAMDVKGKMMEGELVEREKARQIYEGIVRKQKDPALLEWQGGERFQTQIFPIDPGEDKKVVLAYEQAISEQDGEAAYRYSLPSFEGEPEGSHIGAFFFEMQAKGVGEVSFEGFPAEVVRGDKAGEAAVVVEMERFRPKGPFEVRFERPKRDEAEIFYAQRHGESFFMVDLAPALSEVAEVRETRDLILLLDSSAGIGRVEVARAARVASTLLDAFPDDRRVAIVHGDYKISYCNQASKATRKACLEKIEAGGATDLGALISEGLSIGQAAERLTDVVLMSDGVASLGELDADLLLATVREGTKGGKAAFHTLAIGHNPNLEGLAALAGAGRGHAMHMTPADPIEIAAKHITRQIKVPLLTDLKISRVEGKVEAIVPSHRIHLAAGRALAIMGRLPDGPATIKVSATYGDQPYERTFELKPASGRGNEALPRFWARTWIETLQHGDIDRKRVVEASLKYGVMSRYTSFLVLENEEAYERFEIARRKEQERKDDEARNLTKGEGDLADMLAANKNTGDEAEAPDEVIDGIDPDVVEEKMLELEKPKPLAEAEEQMKRLEELSKATQEREEKRELRKEIHTLEDERDEASRRDPRQMERLQKKLEKKKKALRRIDPEKQRERLRRIWAERNTLKDRDRVVFLASLARFDMNDKAEIFLKECLDGAGEDLEVQYTYFEPHATRRHFEDRYLKLVKAMVAAKIRREQVISELLDGGLGTPELRNEIILGVCKGDDADAAACLTWLPKVETDDTEPLTEKLRARRLEEIHTARRQDMANAQLIHEAVALLRLQGHTSTADRLQSELVEFAPHDYGHREAYATALSEQGDRLGACAQYATAVQLNPARRDTFRAMMALRRDKSAIATDLRACLVLGVSKLPVRRDISLVLTWEDPSADIDLHIHEPSGEEVHYQHMESKAGGLLYYDVTDGYGPEIYVLGNAPRGRYRLTLVYYSGERTNVRGTLTILRHAGSPEETRQDIPFVLPKANDKAQIKATTLVVE